MVQFDNMNEEEQMQMFMSQLQNPDLRQKVLDQLSTWPARRQRRHEAVGRFNEKVMNIMDEILSKIEVGFQTMDKRINNLENSVDQRMRSMEESMTKSMERYHRAVFLSVAGMEGAVKTVEQHLDAIDCTLSGLETIRNDVHASGESGGPGSDCLKKLDIGINDMEKRINSMEKAVVCQFKQNQHTLCGFAKTTSNALNEFSEKLVSKVDTWLKALEEVEMFVQWRKLQASGVGPDRHHTHEGECNESAQLNSGGGQ